MLVDSRDIQPNDHLYPTGVTFALHERVRFPLAVLTLQGTNSAVFDAFYENNPIDPILDQLRSSRLPIILDTTE